MANTASDAQIATAIEVLRAYDGEMEPENQSDVDAVVAWLDQLLTDRMMRTEARRQGVTVTKLREHIARHGI